MNVTTIGIDLAKNVFQMHGIDKTGKVVLKKKIKRHHLLNEVAKLPKCLIGMECCGGANYWARQFLALGHEVKLMNPRFVKPYVKSDKNDQNDAEGICEAVTRPTMRFASIKTSEQQDLQSIHRIRNRLVKNRTALSNQLRGLLLEEGIAIQKSFKGLRTKLIEIFSEDTSPGISPQLRTMLLDCYEEFKELDKRIAQYDQMIDERAQKDEDCKKLLEIDGVGPKTATAIIAMVGNGKQFKDGRQMAAYFGLVPRQHSSGGKDLLLGITKRGDPYIRSLLIHGARTLYRHRKDKPQETKRMKWLVEKAKTRGENKAIVAMANKQARTVWAVLTGKLNYRIDHEEQRKKGDKPAHLNAGTPRSVELFAERAVVLEG